MVCAVAPGHEKDMTREGPELFIDGDRIGARGSSLGGDDGAAVAMILALLDDPSLPRPALEAVFTVDEEVGMLGARSLDVSSLKGRTMLNLDSEEEGVFTVSCAGGAHVTFSRKPEREETEALVLRLGAEGLLGGHSGTEIDKGRGNALQLMSRLLDALRASAPLRLISAAGGTAENAIPSSCEALIAAAPEDAMALLDAADRLCAVLRREYAGSDPGLRIRAEAGPVSRVSVLTEAETARLIEALTEAPNGIQAMSGAFPGLPETSLNMGMLTLDGSGWSLRFSLRSSAPDGIAGLIARLGEVAQAAGAEMRVSGEYPAWPCRDDSPLRDRMERIYLRLFGKPPRIVSIHAGLECGILAEKLPGLDCVSIGPDITDIHSPSERLHIPSLQRTWEFVKEILKESR